MRRCTLALKGFFCVEENGVARSRKVAAESEHRVEMTGIRN